MVFKHKDVWIFSLIMTTVFLMVTSVQRSIEERRESARFIDQASVEVQARLQMAQKLMDLLESRLQHTDDLQKVLASTELFSDLSISSLYVVLNDKTKISRFGVSKTTEKIPSQKTIAWDAQKIKISAPFSKNGKGGIFLKITAEEFLPSWGYQNVKIQKLTSAIRNAVPISQEYVLTFERINHNSQSQLWMWAILFFVFCFFMSSYLVRYTTKSLQKLALNLTQESKKLKQELAKTQENLQTQNAQTKILEHSFLLRAAFGKEVLAQKSMLLTHIKNTISHIKLSDDTAKNALATQKIIQSFERMKAFKSDLEIEEVDLKDIVSWALDLFSYDIRKNTVDQDLQSVLIQTDSSLLKIAVANLMKISINRLLPGRFFHILLSAHQEGAHLVIKDNGYKVHCVDTKIGDQDEYFMSLSYAELLEVIQSLGGRLIEDTVKDQNIFTLTLPKAIEHTKVHNVVSLKKS